MSTRQASEAMKHRVLRDAAGNARAYLRPSQIAFNRDPARIRAWEKTRRLGATFGIAAESVRERLSGDNVRDQFFASRDEAAAREYMHYIRYWAGAVNQAVEIVDGEEVIDGRGVKVMSAEIPTPNPRKPTSRIVAQTSNPAAFRSKGGDVVLDEFAHHPDQRGMWKAAYASAMRGGRITFLSTHNGEASFFNELCAMARRRRDPAKYGEPRKNDITISLHTTTIFDAVNEGLVEEINRFEGTAFEREAFLAELRRDAGGEVNWLEEFCCTPSTDASSYFPYDLLRPAVRDPEVCPLPVTSVGELIESMRRALGRGGQLSQPSALYGGCDVARLTDKFVLWLWGRFGGTLRTLGVLRLVGKTWNEMESSLRAVMDLNFAHPGMGGRGNPAYGGGYLRVQRLCIDETGIGHMLAERMTDRYRSRVEGVTFTGDVKEHLATLMRTGFEERTLEIADDPESLAAMNSIGRSTTASGKVRYASDGEGDAASGGHADEFWAAALGVHAAERRGGEARWVGVEGGVLA